MSRKKSKQTTDVCLPGPSSPCLPRIEVRVLGKDLGVDDGSRMGPLLVVEFSMWYVRWKVKMDLPLGLDFSTRNRRCVCIRIFAMEFESCVQQSLLPDEEHLEGTLDLDC